MGKDDEIVEVEEKKPSRASASPRVSVTLPTELRRKVRLAAALADMEENEWCRVVVVTAAERTVVKALGESVV
jgi:hypothetical protein